MLSTSSFDKPSVRSASAYIERRRRNLTSGGSPWRRHRPMARTPKGTCGSWIRSWISPWTKRPVGSATCTEKRYRFLFLHIGVAFLGLYMMRTCMNAEVDVGGDSAARFPEPGRRFRRPGNLSSLCLLQRLPSGGGRSGGRGGSSFYDHILPNARRAPQVCSCGFEGK
ncbi:hypothetical protein B296_00030195 [Ensete ventricosum]|uniref:Uncharacterized protein n=1 Tax=Ensete ventricosum TaxID=4639 RepID=A0A427A8W4_ENSVE|nr:hypothetical protein B296_00030195 [Ensete ventricosum]